MHVLIISTQYTVLFSVESTIWRYELSIWNREHMEPGTLSLESERTCCDLSSVLFQALIRVLHVRCSTYEWVRKNVSIQLVMACFLHFRQSLAVSFQAHNSLYRVIFLQSSCKISSSTRIIEVYTCSVLTKANSCENCLE